MLIRLRNSPPTLMSISELRSRRQLQQQQIESGFYLWWQRKHFEVLRKLFGGGGEKQLGDFIVTEIVISWKWFCNIFFMPRETLWTIFKFTLYHYHRVDLGRLELFCCMSRALSFLLEVRLYLPSIGYSAVIEGWGAGLQGKASFDQIDPWADDRGNKLQKIQCGT